jgi:hypothetical protein
VKKLLVVLVLAGAGYLAYRYVTRAQQVGCYEKLADAWAHGRTDEALVFTDGDEAGRSLKRHPLTSLVDGHMIDAWRGIGYTIESASRSDDGDVAIEAKQTIAFDPPGATTGIGGAMLMSFHHSARLHKTTQGWKVVAFEPTFIEMHAIQRH